MESPTRSAICSFSGAHGGNIEVELTGTWSYAPNFGSLKKLFSFAGNATGTIYENTSRITEALGSIADQFTIGEWRWDAGTSTWRLPIVHRTSAGNPIAIRLKAFSQNALGRDNIKGAVVSAVYTTDQTVYPAATVSVAAGAITSTSVSAASLTDSGLTSGRIVYATMGGLLTDNSAMTFDGTRPVFGNSANLGFSQATANPLAVLRNFWIPRDADLDTFWILDYEDDFAYVDKKATITWTPAPTSYAGSINDPFRDDSNFIYWNAGTSPSPVVLEIDLSSQPLLPRNNPRWSLGLTFRGGNNPTHIKIEAWNTTTGVYDTVFDQDTSIATGYVPWVSPSWIPPGNVVSKLKVTLTVPQPLQYTWRIQRVILYHNTATFDPWHVHVGGGTLYGNLALASGAALVSEAGADLQLTPAAGKNIKLGALKFPNADGGDGQVLKTDGAGNLSWTPQTSGISGLTAGRVPYAASATTLTDSASLAFDGTTLTVPAITSPSDTDLSLTPAAGKNVKVGDLKLPNADGVAGSVLKTDGAGNLSWSMPPRSDNILLNGGFDFFQRQAPATLTARNDDTYGPDRWIVLTQTAAVQCQRIAGSSYSVNQFRLKQHQAAAQRMGVLQIVEAADSKQLRGQDVCFQAQVTCSANQTIRAAILEWTGTGDSVTSDVVRDWTSGTYTPNNFFLASGLAVTQVSLVLPSPGMVTTITVKATVGTSCNNVLVFIWTEGTAAQNVTLDVAEAGLYLGQATRLWQPRPIAEELELCQRYYEKSYALDVAPGTVTVQNGYLTRNLDQWWVYAPTVMYKARKRVSLAPTSYSAGTGASGQMGEFNTVSTFIADRVPTILGAGDTGFAFACGAGTLTVGNMIYFQWAMDAEL